MKQINNLLPLELKIKFYDRKAGLLTVAYGCFLVVILMLLSGKLMLLNNDLKDLKAEKAHIDQLQSDINTNTSISMSLQQQIDEEREKLETYSKDPSPRAGYFDTKGFLRFLGNVMPSDLAILSMECNADKIGMGALDDIGEQGQAPGTEVPGEEFVGQEEVKYSSNIIKNAEGNYVDAETGLPVDAETGEILSSGETETPAEGAAEAGEGETQSNQEQDNPEQDNPEQGNPLNDESMGDGNSVNVLTYDKDLSNSVANIKGYATTLKSVSSFIDSISSCHQYISQYAIVGIEESHITEDLTIYIFEVNVLLGGE